MPEENSVFGETQRKVDRLYDLLYSNGFAQSIKDQKSDIREIKDELHELNKSFAVFTAGRAATCPYRKSRDDERRVRLLTVGVIFAGLSSAAALIATVFRVVA